MEDLLVAALSKRSAISVGDILKVEGPSKIFTLRVQQLKPAAQVSVIGNSHTLLHASKKLLN